ncbi:MAG: restriction endonuclease subunit S, partial [Acetobacteraceae bacterium]
MAAVAQESGGVDLSRRRSAGDVLSGYIRFKDGDVIFAKITPCMENGKIAPVLELPNGLAAGSTEFHVLRPHAVDRRYLWYWLITRAFRSRAQRRMSGSAGQLRVPPDFLREASLPMPPLAEQRRIVARIDSLFAEIAEGERALKAARDGLEKFRRALLKAAVTGELTRDWREKNKPAETGRELLARIRAKRAGNAPARVRGARGRGRAPVPLDAADLPSLPEGWVWTTLSQIASSVRNGTTAVPRAEPNGHEILRISAVRPMIIDETKVRYLADDQALEAADAAVAAGDLLFTRYNGSADLTGVAALYRGRRRFYPDKIIRVRFDANLSPYVGFIEAAVNTTHARHHIASHIKTTAGQHGLSGESLKNTPIPLPPQLE